MSGEGLGSERNRFDVFATSIGVPRQNTYTRCRGIKSPLSGAPSILLIHDTSSTSGNRCVLSPFSTPRSTLARRTESHGQSRGTEQFVQQIRLNLNLGGLVSPRPLAIDYPRTHAPLLPEEGDTKDETGTPRVQPNGKWRKIAGKLLWVYVTNDAVIGRIFM